MDRKPAVKLGRASKIQYGERDYSLLSDTRWPPELKDWETVEPAGPETATPTRTITAGKNLIEEFIVRMPSAPIYGIHRKYEYQYPLERFNYHTMRVLRRPSHESPVERIFLFHNGLNEVDDLGFYYRLADMLLDERSACIIRPFPGHLTRGPFPATYAEKPLDRYLADAGDLFRQYLRFMIESQWLLSMIAPLPSYPVLAGEDLLAEGDGTEQNPGRSDSRVLSEAIYSRSSSRDEFYATPGDDV